MGGLSSAVGNRIHVSYTLVVAFLSAGSHDALNSASASRLPYTAVAYTIH